MKSLVLTDKLFHALKPNIDRYSGNFSKMNEIIICKLDSILEHEKIYTRQGLIDNNILFQTSSFHSFNGDNNVCLSEHIIHCGRYKDDERVIFRGEDDAFTDYPFNYPSFVFEQSLFETNPIEQYNARIELEVPVLGDIDIGQAIAISFPSFEIVDHFFQPFSQDYQLSSDKRVLYAYQLLESILDTLDKHKCKLPVVNICSGNYYKENCTLKEKMKIFNFHA